MEFQYAPLSSECDTFVRDLCKEITQIEQLIFRLISEYYLINIEHNHPSNPFLNLVVEKQSQYLFFLTKGRMRSPLSSISIKRDSLINRYRPNIFPKKLIPTDIYFDPKAGYVEWIETRHKELGIKSMEYKNRINYFASAQCLSNIILSYALQESGWVYIRNDLTHDPSYTFCRCVRTDCGFSIPDKPKIMMERIYFKMDDLRQAMGETKTTAMLKSA